MNKLPEKIYSKVKDELAHENVGAVVGMVEKGNVYYECIGNAELDKKTIFEIGSLTKTFTALLFVLLRNKGVIAPGDAVSDILNDLDFSDNNVGEIRLIELVAHTSGLPRLPENMNPEDEADPYADYQESDLREFLKNHQLNVKQKGEYTYSNLGYGLLGYLLEKVTGDSYESLISEYIIAPLKMKHTYVELPARAKDMLAVGHNEEGKETSRWHNGVFVGGGGILSTPEDLTTFIHNQVQLQESRLQEGVRSAQQTIPQDISDKKQAYGWRVKEAGEEQRIFWRSGRTGGYSAFWGFNKATDKGVVLLANASITPDVVGGYLLYD